ncbi:PLP-dependent aminotransferase family protein [Mesorhizobium erdmanii]|uniref:aminotransferase-like domain-containing protein n=1 Tax=Mesorhizobium erdmanii TaxID=1777866 RepID=UPI000420A863|nr:PLP-dependent aminotransferase family protein [Mesorhizobium erdmanii]
MNKILPLVDPSRNTSESELIDFGRNFPPPCPIVNGRLKATLNAIVETDVATAIRFPRFLGSERDRLAGVKWLSRRLGAPPSLETTILTNGSQSALIMLMAKHVGPSGILLTESLTYPAIKPLAKLLGIQLRGVSIDHDGIDPDDLLRVCRQEGRKARALYCMPTIHNPTSVITSPERRAAIAQIARDTDLQVFEDDIYGVLPEIAPPPLSTYAPERSWYIQGLSKSLAAQLRIAYVVGPSGEALSEVFWPSVRTTNWMVAPIVAEIATRWLETSTCEELLSTVRQETAERRRLATEILNLAPSTGHPSSYHLWLQVPPGMTLNKLMLGCRDHGVSIGSGNDFEVDFDSSPERFRVGLGVPSDRAVLTRGLEVVGNLTQ